MELERPGAVYLAAVLASHAQKGIPAFGIYGKDVKKHQIQKFLRTLKKNAYVTQEQLLLQV